MTLFNNIYIVLGILHGHMAERHLTHQGVMEMTIYIFMRMITFRHSNQG